MKLNKKVIQLSRQKLMHFREMVIVPVQVLARFFISKRIVLLEILNKNNKL
jgi:hypothetical protein